MQACRKCASFFTTVAILTSLHLPLGVVLAKPDETVGGRPEVARAHAAFLRAERHFVEGRYRAAMKEYATGFKLTSLPGFLLNIADCHLRLGNHAEARKAYLRFLGMAGADDPHRAHVERALAEAEAGRSSMRPKEAGPLYPAPKEGPGLRAASVRGSRTVVVRADKPGPTRDEAGEAPGDPAAPPLASAAPATDLAVRSWDPLPQRALSPEVAEVTAAAPPGRNPPAEGTWIWPVVAASVTAAAVLAFFVLRSEEELVQEGSIGTLSR